MGAVFLGASASAQAPWYKWLDKEVIKRIEITGYRKLGYHNHFVRGDREAFDQLEYSGLGDRKLTDTGAVNITGRKVLGIFNFQATILDTRFNDPQGQKFSLNYARNGVTVDAGDIFGSLLNTNQFASFNKTLRGVSVGYRTGRFQVKAIQSQARGSARTVTLNGNNSTGPYYLQVSQIVRGSEEVQVDGVKKTLGTDYVVNYELGSITFIDQIVSPTSSIVVSFEALGFNSQNGIVQGAGVTYDFGKIGRLGLTGMQQKARGSTGLSQRLEKFQGFGEASRAYILQFEPLDGAVFTVRVDGIEQVLGLDYVFDNFTKSIFYFTRFVPATSNVDVLYTPKPTTTADGDRENIGIDYRIPLGKKGQNGSLTLSQASGRLKSDSNPMSGVARGATLDYRTGKIEFRGTVREIPSTYVAVETRGFGRNEKASDWTLNYRPKGPIKYTLRGLNSRVENRVTQSNGNVTFYPARFTVVQGSLAYTPPFATTPWTLEHRRTESNYSGSRTRLDTTSLTASKNFGRLDTRVELQRQDGIGPVTNAGVIEEGNLSLNTLRFGLGYNPSSNLTLQGRTSISAVNANGKRGSGTDTTIGASYQPNQRLAFNAQYALSDSGQLATLGSFQNGFGLGYGGNGFSGGVTGDSTTGATSLRQWSLSASYTPTDRINLTAGLSATRQSGSVSSNSDSQGLGLAATLDFGKGHSFATSIDRTQTTFIDSPITSSATNWDLYLQGNPAGRWSYRLGASFLLNGGNSEFKQNSHAYEASLTYRFANRQALNFNVSSGRTRGYYPQDDFDYGITYQYQIWQNLALNLSYRVRDVRNLDPTLTSGAYRSGGFDLELSFNFGR